MVCNLFRNLEYNEITFGKVIGSGITSKVYRGSYNNHEYAFKVYSTENDVWENKESMVEAFTYELETAKKCIGMDQTVQMEGYCFNEVNGVFSIIIMMELLDSIGDLTDYLEQSMFWNDRDDIKPNGIEFGIFNYEENTFWEFTMSEKRKQKIAIDIITAVKELHGRRIIHGDIKTNNLVYHKSFNFDKSKVKLIDIGVSYNDCGNECKDIDFHVGTDGYMAPEQLEGKLHFKSDTYSVAVTIIELWNGEIWLSGKGFKVCRSEVLKSLRKIEAEYSDFGKVLRSCLSLDYSKRPTLDKLLTSTENINLDGHIYRR